MKKSKKFINYIKSEYKLFFILLYVFLTFGGIFIFSNLNMDYFILCLEIILFVTIIYLIINYINFKNEENLKEKLEKLKKENSNLQNKIFEERKDIQEYFLLWLHQIKTPITVSNLILRDKNSKDAKKLKEEIFYIEQYANLAINFLKIKNRESDMDITNVNLDKILKNLFKKYSMLFIEKKISLDYKSVEINVISDSKYLSLLIEQILSNAIKYTEKGKISVYFEKYENSLYIEDTGIGIRPEDLNKIFDKGYSGFNGRLNEKSSGIGLYLVKRISKIINVKVSVESKVNKGSKFKIKFLS
ncbi:MAG: ATP-binding protein [Peptoniphilaceae bacterium]|nr:ATP-binding protein [Peptoniphilaceae bacterium]MDY3737717.1 ATP-binding protein [Peptoniphilaceae bacterium]